MVGVPAVAVSVLMVAGAFFGVGAGALPESDSLLESWGRMAFGGASAADPCPGAAGVRSYDVTALRVPVSYNRWGDFDPHGRLFVLNENVVTLLDQVATSAAEAELPEMAAPLRALRDAFRAGDVGAVLAATGALEAGLADLLDQPTAQERGRLQPAPLAQPFVVRAHLGECVRFRLFNALPEPASVEVASAVTAPGMGMALGAGAPDLTPPGGLREYVVYVPPLAGMEGAHILRSHADPRFHTKHGLFGALVAEPVGSAWLSADDGTPLASGQEAMIARPDASDYREHLHFYHDEAELFNFRLRALPTLDRYGIYGPGTKAMNLRTEPFAARFELHDSLFEKGVVGRAHDKSQGYGSYTYGDPGVYLPRGYVGDPTKFRLVNVGPGQGHVHHLHGGGIRWRASPVAEDTQFDDGFVKTNPVVRAQSERLDVQLVNPGESYNLEPEGGAGGVQQSVGDFLFHCHIVEHYLAGMWGFWRTYNTKQPDLAELPDRAGLVPDAVTSVGLLGRTLPDGSTLDAANVGAWVESFLPPRGVPQENDASVWDWAVEATPAGPLYRGEPESAVAFPNYASATPGERPAILFNPDNGKPAYPMLRPHFGQRPPFAPDHGPAPYLKPATSAVSPDGLCPSGAPPRSYAMVALSTAVPLNEFDTDPEGQIFVHAADKAGVVAGTTPAKSMILRANQGDCVDVTLTSQLDEFPAEDEFGDPGPLAHGETSKVNMHIHLVQFDVQASDGVITGFNYETSVRSALAATRPVTTTSGSTLPPTVAGVAGPPSVVGGDTVLPVNDTGVFLDATGSPKVGSMVGVGLTEPTLEFRRLVAVDVAGGTITLAGALAHGHAPGDLVGYEFVRYRWYPDVELGMVYWHDHVNGLISWRHGLFGGLVVEPAGSRWLDPKRAVADAAANPDEPSLHVADVVNPGAPGDASRNYRELVLQFLDRGCRFPDDEGLCSAGTAFPLPPQGEAEPSSFNLRSEPFDRRNALAPMSSTAPFSRDEPSTPLVDETTVAQGDPATDLLEAFPGDGVVVRLLYAGQTSSRAVATFGLAGHRFAFEQHNPGSRVVDTVSFGISSQHNLRLDCGAGGCASLPGDYPYFITSPETWRRGAWGLMRVHDPSSTAVHALPSNPAPVAGSLPAGPVRAYDVVAMRTNVAVNQPAGLVQPLSLFALASEKSAIESGALRPHPLVLRALPGERVEVTLTNHLTHAVSLHASLLLAGPGDLGIPAGTNPLATVAPGGTRTYTWYADRELGVTHLASYAAPSGDAGLGLYGALVVEPAGSAFAPATGPSATVTLAGGAAVAEHVLLYHSEDHQFESSTMPYAVDVAGLTAVNYRTEPWLNRIGRASEHSCQRDSAFCGDGQGVRWEVRNARNPVALQGAADTPLLAAQQGQPLVVRAVGGAGDQVQTHRVAGHAWALDWAKPGCRDLLAACGSNLVGAAGLGPREVSNAWIPAAGPGGAGDYFYGTARDAFMEDGAWGVLRVV